METKRFWYNNGKIEALTSKPDPIRSLLLNFGLGLHLAWRTSGTRIPFFREQFSVLNEMLSLNQIKTEDTFNDVFLKVEITRLLNRNRIFKGALVHLIFLPGKSTVTILPAEFYMLTENLHEERFVLNSRGLKLGWIKGHIHPGSWFMPRIGNYHHIHTLWRQEQRSLNWDSAYFTNMNHKIIECTDANIFIIKGKHLYTPSLNLGVTPRAIRKVILRIAPKLELKTIETDKLEPTQLASADEIFIANDQKGIQWIVGYKDKRYFRKYSELLNTMINSEWAEAN